MTNKPKTLPPSKRTDASKPLWLDIVGTFGQALLAPMLGGAIAYYGYATSKATSRDDVTEKYVSVAVDVLKGKRDASNGEIFAWAAKTLNVYASVPFTQEAIKQLEGGSLAGNPVSFDISRHDIIDGRLGNVYLTINNTTPDPLTIKSVRIVGSNDLTPPCKIEVAIDPMESIAFSFQPRSIKLASVETIARCNQSDEAAKSNYQLVDVSTSPTFDAFEKAQGHAYNLRNMAFAVAIEYENKSSSANTLFGAYLHYLKDDGSNASTGAK